MPKDCIWGAGYGTFTLCFQCTDFKSNQLLLVPTLPGKSLNILLHTYQCLHPYADSAPGIQVLLKLVEYGNTLIVILLPKQAEAHAEHLPDTCQDLCFTLVKHNITEGIG